VLLLQAAVQQAVVLQLTHHGQQQLKIELAQLSVGCRSALQTWQPQWWLCTSSQALQQGPTGQGLQQQQHLLLVQVTTQRWGAAAGQLQDPPAL
jgi:hypothetical protein